MKDGSGGELQLVRAHPREFRSGTLKPARSIRI
jgi:hypothetical protein